MSQERYEIPICLALLVASAIIQISLISPLHNWGGDFAAYLHQGSALANSTLDELHSIVQFRVQNSDPTWVIGPDYYPWGFPTVLAAVFAVFGESLFVAKVTIIAFTLGCQLVTYFLLRGRVPLALAVTISFLWVINSYFLMFAGRVYSDIPFTFFVLLTLLLCRYFIFDREEPTAASFAAIGLAAFAAVSVRTHAVALLPAIATMQILAKTDRARWLSVPSLLGSLKKIRAIDFVPHLVFFLGAAALVAATSDPIESYAGTGEMPSSRLEHLIATVKFSLYYYGVLPISYFLVPIPVYALVIAPLILIGCLRGGFKHPELFAYAIFHMAILMVYPGRQGVRFIMPVLPLLLLFLYVGAHQCIAWLSRKNFESRVREIAEPALVVALAALMTVPLATGGPQKVTGKSVSDRGIGPYDPSSEAAFSYIREHVGTSESVVFWKPRVLSYLTDRNSAVVTDYDELVSGKFDYVLVYQTDYPDTEKGKILVDFTADNPAIFRTVYSNADFDLYAIDL